MESKSITSETDIKATAHDLYKAFMDSEKHEAMTGGSADIDPRVGGEFSVWDGSLSGKTLELVPNKKIVQRWRSEEEGWPEDHFSKLTIEFKDNGDGTAHISLSQSDIPEGSAESVKQGWEDYYWEPMKKYFEK